MEFLVITGMSGAGKSQAMNVLEDMGYYCMDNLPPALLTNFASLCLESKEEIKKVAVVVDIRSGEFFDHLFKGLQSLNDMGIDHRILFLDAREEILVKRFKELRRPHPLNPEGSIIEGIDEEKTILYDIKRRADHIIDTSDLTLGMLKEQISQILSQGEDKRTISVSIISFGFKNGTLLDGDNIFDVRFIPNPYYIPELKEFNGSDQAVKNYVLKWPQTNIFITKAIDMLEFLIPHYTVEGKTQLIVGIGCTGGRHRSVAISNEIGRILKDNGHRVSVEHRDTKIGD